MIQPLSGSSQYPLCVDLDGTLVFTDVSFELFLEVLRSKPWILPLAPLWWIRGGRACLKFELDQRTSASVETLPFNDQLLKFLREQFASGRSIVLATGSPERAAREVSRHVGIFSDTIASTRTVNMTGAFKARELVQRYGETGFDYIGNSTVDLQVWKWSRKKYLVASSPKLRSRLELQESFEKIFVGFDKSVWSAWVESIRIGHWAKNILLFVPIVASHRWDEGKLILATLVAFFPMSMAASSGYFFNDLLDLNADRRHPVKSKRPFARGQLSIPLGFGAVAGFGFISVSWAYDLSIHLGWVVFMYLVLSWAYSLFLKRIAGIDVVVLAGLYSLRLIAGGAVEQISVSNWLLSFSLLFFLNLALMKRYIELTSDMDSKNDNLSRRGYSQESLSAVFRFGVLSGGLSILIFLLYVCDVVDGGVASYPHPHRLGLAWVFLMYWIARAWNLARRGAMTSDPFDFVIRDKQGYVLFFFIVGSVLWAMI